MPLVTAAHLRTQLETGETGPLYLLVGADDAEKASVAAEFGEMVEEGLRAFNVERLYGGEMKVDDLLRAANMLPMMAPRRVVVILQAEKLLVPKRESKAAEEEQERLEAFIRDPALHATVVFVCGQLDRRRKAVRLLLDRAGVVDCGTIEDAADAERWIKTRAAREGANLDAGAVRALVARSGNNLVRLRSGLERVMLYALGQPAITADDVKQVVAPAADVQEDFGIANALRDGNAAAALRQLAAALDNGAAPFLLMGQLRWVAEKAPASRMREAIEAVFRTDLALKSSAGDPRILLERLVVELAGMQGPVRRAFPAL
ncbi:MAG: DNA polymerase III subunit delta [Vicinamibacterales bacterium]